jgi:hypothetical protein
MSVELQSVGSMGVACDKLARMVALSTAFQTTTQSANYAQARAEYVHRRNVIGTEAAVRPLAIVSQLEGHQFELIAGGERNHFIQSGDLSLWLAIDTPTEYYSDNVLAETYADNFFTPVVTEVAALANADDADTANQVVSGEGHLDIRRISRIMFAENNRENWESIGRFWLAMYAIEWGGV